MTENANVDEHPLLKKRRVSGIDFSFCLKCQTRGGTLVKKPKSESYERFLEGSKKRAKYGDKDFIPISKRLMDMSSKDLLQENASWQLECYKSATNKGHIERLKTSYDKALLTGHVPNPSTRKRPSAWMSIPSFIINAV